ncbi:MAG: ABC-2 family transporter protein [Chloroflexi bacterium]|nr:ABC-2 family transporter protein [Chloroflexota bacterium]
MARLLRLWRLYAVMDLLFVARGPRVALIYYFSDLVRGAAAATATFLLAERFDGIGAWTKPQVLFLLGYALLVRLLIDTFFNYNLAHVSRRIGRGQLDHLLIQPQPLWMALVTEGFAPVTGTGMLLPSAILLGAAGQQLNLIFSPGWCLQFIAYLVASITVVLSFEYAWASIAFWAPRAAEEINSHTWDLLQALTPFPLDGLSGWALGSLLTLVPAGLVAWYPSRALLGLAALAWPDAAVAPAAAVLFAAFAAWIFTRGLHHYGRTGSSRYLDYGHRR